MFQAAQALAGAGESKAGGPNTVLRYGEYPLDTQCPANLAYLTATLNVKTFIFILRVIVEHMVYPVTLDVIFQIFSRVGKVMKIVTFTKNNTFQVKL